jgi:hypothetical protein
MGKRLAGFMSQIHYRVSQPGLERDATEFDKDGTISTGRVCVLCIRWVCDTFYKLTSSREANLHT